ncbi:MAG: hypothetical protein AAF805_07115, partial [Planctomycetota bacterium]
MRSLLLSFTAALLTAAHAQADQWINALGGSYSDGANWQDGSPPTATEAAVFGVGNQAYVVTVSDGQEASRLIVESGDSIFLTQLGGSYTLNDPLGSGGFPTESLTLGTFNGAGSLTISDGTVVANDVALRAGSDLVVSGSIAGDAVFQPSSTIEVSDGVIFVGPNGRIESSGGLSMAP